MDSANDRLVVYRELADTYDRLGQVSMRDRFLILAADAALETGQAAEAERHRQRLLHTTRYHMLRPYNSFEEAVQVPDVQTYLRDLRANYPLEVARQLLGTLLPGSGGPAVLPFAPVASHAPPAPPAAAPSAPDPPMAEPLIPVTAPLVDVYGRQPTGARPTWQPAGPLPDSLEMTPAPPAHRPLAQPLPGRTTPRHAAPAALAVHKGATYPLADSGDVAATMALPSMAPLPPAPPATPEPTSGSWLAFTLVGLVLTAGLALVAFTLARPFLPAGWSF